MNNKLKTIFRDKEHDVTVAEMTHISHNGVRETRVIFVEWGTLLTIYTGESQEQIVNFHNDKKYLRLPCAIWDKIEAIIQYGRK